MTTPPTISVALAGRRIDLAGAEPARFPNGPEHVAAVKGAIKALFKERRVTTLIASAACGADILALEAARDLGIRTRIVLPFAASRFRETSVVDRGVEWGARFDVVVEDADRRGDVVVVDAVSGDDEAAYALATRRIVVEALSVSEQAGSMPLAVAVWDQNPRPKGDATLDFLEQAERAGIERVSISTV